MGGSQRDRLPERQPWLPSGQQFKLVDERWPCDRSVSIFVLVSGQHMVEEGRTGQDERCRVKRRRAASAILLQQELELSAGVSAALRRTIRARVCNSPPAGTGAIRGRQRHATAKDLRVSQRLRLLHSTSKVFGEFAGPAFYSHGS